MTPGRVPEVSELADDLEEIKSRLFSIEEKLDAKYVPRELYEARHTGLRSEVALMLATVQSEQAATRAVATSARAIGMWALGLVASAVVVALVGFLVAGVGGQA